MLLRELDSVVLQRDLPEHGLRRGDLGAVVAVHRSGTIEVEFVRASGHTLAVLELKASEVRRASDRDVVAARPTRK
jgi:hypothetical protein